MFKLKAQTRLKALVIGDESPANWKQGDIDVTFTPVCKVVREIIGKDVHGIRAANDQHWVWVYVETVHAKDLPKLDHALRAAKIPGNPRFDSVTMAAVPSYKGLLVIKIKLY